MCLTAYTSKGSYTSTPGCYNVLQSVCADGNSSSHLLNVDDIKVARFDGNMKLQTSTAPENEMIKRYNERTLRATYLSFTVAQLEAFISSSGTKVATSGLHFVTVLVSLSTGVEIRFP